MKLIISQIGNHQTIDYAAQELERYIRQIDPMLFIERREYFGDEGKKDGVIRVGLNGAVEASEDDTIRISVKEASGYITGSNTRSVLLAVYRFLQEIGCRWLYPGKDGEVIPQFKIDARMLNVEVTESASYRHRAVCMEGATGYEHLYDMIDWLPKVGMNGYFVQFLSPSPYLNRWEQHADNPNLQPNFIEEDEALAIQRHIEREIKKRDLLYHNVGHGWTAEPFGLCGTNWRYKPTPVSDEVKAHFAQVNGVREISLESPINTHLCYSNEVVRSKMINTIVQYCREHPQVDYLHFWLADGYNNQCECDECRKYSPSDLYVLMLNELDKRLTDEGLDTKIVFLLYFETMWTPEKYKIVNQDRFTMMFAPISRAYTSSFADVDLDHLPLIPPYERNKIQNPHSEEELIARLRKWQDQFDGDSFDFDYHLMWYHKYDPGYYECARLLHRDMTALERIGLNGMVSCQVQRAALPTGLPMYAMARGLWDKTSDFDEIACEYFTAAFGENAMPVMEYMQKLSELFCPAYLISKTTEPSPEAAERYAEVQRTVAWFKTEYLEKCGNSNASWKYLVYHAELCVKLAQALKLRALGDAVGSAEAGAETMRYAAEHELEIHRVFDVSNLASLFKILKIK